MTVLFAFFLWRAQSKSTIHRALLDMHKEYADPKMKDAVKKLWYFYKKECKGSPQISEDIDKKAEEKLRSKYKNILNGKKSAKKYSNLDDSRRRVIHFYYHMTDIYFHNIIGNHRLPWAKRLLFYYWSEADLRIIPKILVPLHEVRAEFDGFKPEDPDPQLKKINDFYQHAKEFSDP